MNAIVERLRAAKAPGRDPTKYAALITVAEAHEAADEIERLTAELAGSRWAKASNEVLRDRLEKAESALAAISKATGEHDPR